MGEEVIELYKDAISTYGVDHQLLKALEEHLEISLALVRYILGRDDREHIIEEMNDSNIMNEQLSLILNVKDKELSKQRLYKLNRLRERIKDEQRKSNR